MVGCSRLLGLSTGGMFRSGSLLLPPTLQQDASTPLPHLLPAAVASPPRRLGRPSSWHMVSSLPGPSSPSASLHPPEPLGPAVHLHLGKDLAAAAGFPLRFPLGPAAPACPARAGSRAAARGAAEAPGRGRPACHPVRIRGWHALLPVPLGHRVGSHGVG